MNTILGKISAIALSTFAASLSFGAGFMVQEQGASNMGTAMAGAVTNANNDASAAFGNPSAAAFMPLKEGRTLVNTAISAVLPTLGFSDATSDYEADCDKDAYVPNFFLAHKFTDSISATVSVTAPFGLESKYDSNWNYADQGVHSYLMTMDFNPSLVYKITDWISVSGGLSCQYAYCKLTQDFMGSELKLKGDSWSVGGNIGITVQYAEDGRVAFHWRSAVFHELSGTASMNGNGISDITAEVTLPHTFTVGVYQRLRGSLKEFALMADYTYATWSSFDELAVSGFPTVPENWKDTSRVSLGVHYYPDFVENLTFRMGVCYDESPVNCPDMRTVRIPCSDRVWFSTGIGYKMGDLSFDVAYSYIMTIGSSEINRSEMFSTVNGHFYGHIHVISLQMGFEF